MNAADLLAPAPPTASAALHEAVRVRRAILRALRRGLRPRFRLVDAVELCRCDATAARSAIETLLAIKLIAAQGGNGQQRWFELTERGREVAEL